MVIPIVIGITLPGAAPRRPGAPDEPRPRSEPVCPERQMAGTVTDGVELMLDASWVIAASHIDSLAADEPIAVVICEQSV
jgi:hypothetical protein